MIEVGAFKYDPKTKLVEGPAEYMREQGDAKLKECLSGKSAVVEYGLSTGGDPATLILVALQTDYAGWIGMKGLAARG